MNIEKLAKHLKEFTLDEINMIAECDCKTELEHLLNSSKICFEQGLYKYKENINSENYEIFITPNRNIQNISSKDAFERFLNDYVKNNCKLETYKRYSSVIKYHLLPYFKNKYLAEICNNDIKELFNEYKLKKLPPKTFRNNLSLLNQIIKYYQNLGIIDRKCNFQVRRLSNKTNFKENRMIFEGDLCQK